MQQEADVVQDLDGNAVAGAAVQVLVKATGELAKLFADDETKEIANPVYTDANGRYAWKAANGKYRSTVTIGGRVFVGKADITLFDPAANGAAGDIGFTQTGTGTVPRTVEDELRERVSVKQFGAVSGSGEVYATAVRSALSVANEVHLGAKLNEDTTLPVQDSVDIGYGRTVRNTSMGRSVKNIIFRMTGNLGRVENTRLSSGAIDKFAIQVGDGVDSATVPYYNTVNNVNVHDGSAGIELGGVEFLSYNFRVTNPTASRGAHGIKQQNAIDTSLIASYLENVEVGLESWRSITAFDTHVVYAKDAFDMQQSSATFGSSAKLFGNYCDSPKRNGMILNRSKGTYFGTDIWNLGKFADYATQIGLNFQDYGHTNAFFGLYINDQDDAFTARVTSYMTFKPTSVNNLFVHITGKYKLRDEDRVMLRKQTVIGATDGWARHNNVNRKDRLQALNVAAAADVTLEFQLDYSYPAASNNFYLFKGTWASRSPSASTGAFGEIHICVAHGTSALSAGVVTRLVGPAAFVWSVQSSAINGDKLTVVLRNDYTSAAHIAVELERSVDPAALSF